MEENNFQNDINLLINAVSKLKLKNEMVKDMREEILDRLNGEKI